uniref:Carbonyl reductase n=1 Tax=Scophthalmus maximus TaxID=52904 RepID=A0A8D2ZTY6_SCOMX
MSTKVAVVTGSNKGIGLAIVRALCGQFQGDVYITARDEGRGREAAASLASDGLTAMFHQLDINDLSSVRAAAAFFKDKYGGVDVLVNNAGIAFKGSDNTPFAVQADVTLKTNFFATRDVLTHFLPIVKAGGRVVNVSSFVGAQALSRCSPALQQRLRSEDVTEDELAALMQQFVDKSKTAEHEQAGWPETAYGVSKTGLTVRSTDPSDGRVRKPGSCLQMSQRVWIEMLHLNEKFLFVCFLDAVDDPGSSSVQGETERGVTTETQQLIINRQTKNIR